jgi:hypothetical protein
VQQVDDGVEAAEVVLAGADLDVGPAEDVDRDEVDAGLGHQRDVLLPDVRRPLLGVVVAPQGDARQRQRAATRNNGFVHRFLACVYVHTLPRGYRCRSNV